MPPPLSRLHVLLNQQCRIFSHTFNPSGARIGTSVLRQRLRGPSVAAYYPRKGPTVKTLLQALRKADPDADLDTWDDREQQRFEDLEHVKARGKGAPKKKRSKEGESLILNPFFL